VDDDARNGTVRITLSPLQVEEVLRSARGGAEPGLASLILDSLPGSSRPSEADLHLSRSLVRGLSILASFGSQSAERGIVEIASDLGMSPSTAHRYAQTLLRLGLLERCPTTRKYRLPSSRAEPGSGASGARPPGGRD